MSDVLYLQTEKNVEVHHPHVHLQDLAALSCSNSNILNRLRVLPITTLDPGQAARYVLPVSSLIREIQKKEPNLEIVPLGEPVLILTYQDQPAPAAFWQGIKTFFVCCSAFFGAAFSIMTFNNDVDVPALFRQIHTMVTGHPSDNFTVLEISYSIGVGLGVLIFFNHFGHMKITSDPSPMEVKMSLYEDNINETLLSQSSQNKNSL